MEPRFYWERPAASAAPIPTVRSDARPRERKILLGNVAWNTATRIFPGFAASLVLAVLAWHCSPHLPLVGAPVLGILLGMGMALTGDYPSFKEGTRFCSKKILQFSVVLLGFEMNIRNVVAAGAESLFVMIFTLCAAFLTAWGMGKLLRLPPVTTTLIGVGTAICGGSAIAATAPILQADDREIAHSISTIFLFNVAAVFLFPAIGHLLHMSDAGFGLWAGTAVNDTSSVLAASYAYSDAAGQLATVVKLTRTLMIIPVTFALSLYMSRKTASGETKNGFSFSKAFPWFVLGFVIAVILNSIGIVPPKTAKFLSQSGKFLIVVAMASIGLNTHLGRLLRNGLRPILLGLACWVNLALVSLAVQYFLGLL